MKDASTKQQTKEKIQTQLSTDRIIISLSLAHQRKNKQTREANSKQISPYTKITQIIGPTLVGQKPKGRNNSKMEAYSNTVSPQEIRKISNKQHSFTPKTTRERRTKKT